MSQSVYYAGLPVLNVRVKRMKNVRINNEMLFNKHDNYTVPSVPFAVFCFPLRNTVIE